MGEASTSKVKGKRAGYWKRKKGKAKAKTVIVAKDTKSAPITLVGMGKGKKRIGTQQQSRENDICAHCREKGIGRGIVPIYLPIKVCFVVEVNMVTNSASWVLDTGCGAHICNDLQVLLRSRKLSKDEVVLRLGDGKFVAAEAGGIINLNVNDRVKLELKDCYFVPSMIKNIISISLLDNTSFQFLINKNCFYLMKDGSSHLLGKLNNGLYILQRMKRLVDSKSLEIDNLDNLPACESSLKGKMTRKHFIGQSKLVNGLLDLIYTDVCGPLNTQARGGFSYFITFTDDHLRAIQNSGPDAISEIWHDKPASYKYLRVWGSPAYVKRLVGDKLDLRSSLCRFILKKLQGITFMTPPEQKVFVLRDAVLLERGFPTDTRRDELLLEEISQLECHSLLRGMVFLGVTSQLDNNPKTYREAMSDIDSEKWLEAMKSEMDSMSSNQVSTLVDRPKGVRLVECKWVYKRMTMKYGMDWKMAFLNGFVEEVIYMDQPEGFTVVGEEQKGCHLQRSIYGLKQASRSWNIRFNEVIQGYDFVKNDFDPCVYKKVSGSLVVFLVLYVDDILLIGNDIKMLGDTKAWLSTQFSMKDLEVHWTAVKTILRYLRRTKDVFLVYDGGELILEGFSDASFQSDDDDAKSYSGFVFNDGVVAWKSSKQDTTADSTTETEYIAASEAVKEAIWMKNYI
ncbi:UNVERIFIED_CONTAM: Retrovirus-related Pol polyprotein from transposon TNT 1-94 [Sesamum angustifolium]|uniref:Retrovirus-related Pol polyprotein from transposon TNT 1-94 n=1 Tax=Sesamum angustifolium TaxID=2727405 RepID=A0AAW2JMS0_9LAMI